MTFEMMVDSKQENFSYNSKTKKIEISNSVILFPTKGENCRVYLDNISASIYNSLSVKQKMTITIE